MTDLLTRVEDWNTKVRVAKDAWSTLVESVTPVVVAAIGPIGPLDGLSRIDVTDATVEVTVSGSRRGWSFGDDYELPRSIFEAADPVAAATEWRAKQKAENEAGARAEKLQKLAALQEELGIPPATNEATT